jgi:hypothetical protein
MRRDALPELWLLSEAHDALVRECSEQRRRRIVYGLDPADAWALRVAAQRVVAAAIDVETATLHADELRDYERREQREERTVSLLNAATPGTGDLFLRAVEDAADALLAADELANARDPGERYDAMSMRALYGRPPRSARAPAVLSFAGHLVAVGVRVGVALALLEAWDREHNVPPIGSDECERLLRYAARKHAERLEGIAA